MVIGAVMAALVVGFLAGLFAFKVKSRWCDRCGSATVTLAEHCRQVEAEHHG